MVFKRPSENEADTSQPKKQRTAFKVGPDNLPDGIWKRKVVKIKKNLIHKAKVKKSYAKLKAREPALNKPIPNYFSGAPEPISSPQPQISQELHPERKAMIEAPEEPPPAPLKQAQVRPDRKHSRKPRFFEKEAAFAEKQRAEVETKRLEFERRDKERKLRIVERERLRKTMARARVGSRNGQRKLGRESKVLLEKVRRLVEP